VSSFALADRAALAVGRQLAHPSGFGGRVLAAILRQANRRPTRALIEALEINCGHHVLDVGCGDGSGLAAIPEARSKCGVEPSETMLLAARNRLGREIDSGVVTLRAGDMLDLPFRANRFDRILASNVLYFCEDVPRFVGECRRVARPGALLGIYVTSATSMRNWRFAGPATHRHFTRQHLEAELLAGGVDRASLHIVSLPMPGGIEGLLAIVRFS
jgi:ubiquinone/menaquinone biosynthesis C-methylase UbiE